MFNQTTTVNTLIVYQFTLHSCECVRINNFVYNVYVCVIAVLLCLIESIPEQKEGWSWYTHVVDCIKSNIVILGASFY